MHRQLGALARCPFKSGTWKNRQDQLHLPSGADFDVIGQEVTGSALGGRGVHPGPSAIAIPVIDHHHAIAARLSPVQSAVGIEAALVQGFARGAWSGRTALGRVTSWSKESPRSTNDPTSLAVEDFPRGDGGCRVGPALSDQGARQQLERNPTSGRQGSPQHRSTSNLRDDKSKSSVSPSRITVPDTAPCPMPPVRAPTAECPLPAPPLPTGRARPTGDGADPDSMSRNCKVSSPKGCTNRHVPAGVIEVQRSRPFHPKTVFHFDVDEPRRCPAPRWPASSRRPPPIRSGLEVGPPHELGPPIPLNPPAFRRHRWPAAPEGRPNASPSTAAVRRIRGLGHCLAPPRHRLSLRPRGNCH